MRLEGKDLIFFAFVSSMPGSIKYLVCAKSQESKSWIRQGWKIERGQEEGRNGKCKQGEQESGISLMFKAPVGLADCHLPT